MCSGLDYQVLFCRRGYTPHYVEHVIDPLDGREKLVMADPHTRRAALVYDMASGHLEWEFRAPGSGVPNPHTARMLLTDVEGFGSAGDVYMCDRDNNIIVVERPSGDVKFRGEVPWDAGLVHEAFLTPDGDALIITDYFKNVVAKLSLPDLKPIWMRKDIPKPSKVSAISGMVEPWHNPSFGGQYLVCSNETLGAVLELRDEDGSTAWACPRPDGTGAWLLAPHSAFRLGRIECKGNLTVVGSEAGGGIMALDYLGRPAWAITGGVAFWDDEGLHYTVGPEGIGEITHVFPTLDGRIGFCSWLGLNCSVVGALRRLPDKQEAHFTLAHELEISGGLRYLGPPIKAEGWDELLIIVECEGPGPVRWRVEGIGRPLLDLRGPAPPAVLITSATARPGEASSAYIREPYKWLRLAVEPVGARARISAHVLLRRG